MLNKTTAEELAMFLPVVEKDLNKEVYQYFAYKWGLVDEQWHSTKNALKHTGIQLKDNPEKLERDVERMILDRHNKMFICRSCKNDYRKVGLQYSTTGTRRETVFMTQKGKISRSTQEMFIPVAYKNVQQQQYQCASCGHTMTDDDEIMFIMDNGISKNSMLQFAQRFCGAKPKVVSGVINTTSYNPRGANGPSNMWINVPDIFYNNEQDI